MIIWNVMLVSIVIKRKLVLNRFLGSIRVIMTLSARIIWLVRIICVLIISHWGLGIMQVQRLYVRKGFCLMESALKVMCQSSKESLA